jgi:hypothetical protein
MDIEKAVAKLSDEERLWQVIFLLINPLSTFLRKNPIL